MELIGGAVSRSHCTVQVFEETGFDISERLEEDSCAQIWEKHNGSQKRTKLFFIPGVDASTEFAPQARKACRFPSAFLKLVGKVFFSVQLSVADMTACHASALMRYKSHL